VGVLPFETCTADPRRLASTPRVAPRWQSGRSDGWGEGLQQAEERCDAGAVDDRYLSDITFRLSRVFYW